METNSDIYVIKYAIGPSATCTDPHHLLHAILLDRSCTRRSQLLPSLVDSALTSGEPWSGRLGRHRLNGVPVEGASLKL